MKQVHKKWLGKSSGPKACAGGLVVILAVLGSFNVQAASCPEPSQIEYRNQSGTAIYTSKDGLWRGENPEDNTDYSDNIGFHSVAINSDSKYVACSYEGTGTFSAVRLSLRWNAGRAIAPAGSGWQNNNCRAQYASECRFD